MIELDRISKKISLSRLRSVLSLALLANHYPALHGLRVLAIVSAIQVHVTYTMRRLPAFRNAELFDYSRRIFFGMDLFFILSGFLIGTILLHSVDNKTLRGIGRFYLRRGFRTFPLYYFVLTGMVLFYPMATSRTANVLMEFFYLTNYGEPVFKTRVMHWGWSLSVEEHFYLLAPLFLAGLHLLGTHRARIATLIALWTSGLGMRLFCFSAIPESLTKREFHTAVNSIYLTTHSRYDILIAGILIAYVHHHFREPIAAWLSRQRVRYMLYTVSITCLFALVFKPSFLYGNHAVFQLVSWGTFTGIMYFPLILLLIHTDGPFVRFLSKPTFLRIATLGYGMYLIHMPVCSKLLPLARVALKQYGLPLPLVWTGLLIATLIGAFVLSYVLHIIVEKPALALRERLVPRTPRAASHTSLDTEDIDVI